MRKGLWPVAVCVASMAGASGVWADSWLAPEEKTYSSQNAAFRFRVVPRELRGALAYFEDQVEGRPRPGQAGGGQKRCHGILEKREARPKTGYAIVWSRPLRNDVSPVSAVVSDDGKYAATFDNWHSTGYGPNAAVVYGPAGDVVRSYSVLDLLLPEEIDRLSMTVSSVWWHKDARFGNGILEVQVRQQDHEGNERPPITIRVAPPTGRLLRPEPALKRIAAQQALCRTLAGDPKEMNWAACRAKDKSSVWCALCRSIYGR